MYDSLLFYSPREIYFFTQEVEDAQKIQRTVIDCFERASLPTVSDEEKKRILHFAVVGGGPTGVEFAAALHDFVNEDLVKLYPRVKDLVKITLLEAGDHILNMLVNNLSHINLPYIFRNSILLFNLKLPYNKHALICFSSFIII